jgi:Glycosyltransferase Family 4
MIRSTIGKGSVIHLLTAEPDNAAANDPAFHHLMAELQIQWIPTQYAPIGWKGWFLWVWNVLKIRFYCFRHNIQVLHAFAPVAGALAWMANRYSKKKLVIDSWEPHADAMVETGVWTKHSKAFKILFALEKSMARDADFLIAAHPSMLEYSTTRYGISPRQIAYKPACIDLTIFDPYLFDKHELRIKFGLRKEDTIGICVSQLGGMYYFEETLQLMHLAQNVFANGMKWLLLTSTPSEKIKAAARVLNINLEPVTILKCAPEKVPMYLAMADFAYNPQMSVPSKRYGTPVKNGEYWAMGLPILLMPDTSQDSHLVQKYGVGVVLTSTQEIDQQTALTNMKLLLQNPNIGADCRQIASEFRDPAIAQLAYAKVYGRT